MEYQSSRGHVVEVRHVNEQLRCPEQRNRPCKHSSSTKTRSAAAPHAQVTLAPTFASFTCAQPQAREHLPNRMQNNWHVGKTRKFETLQTIHVCRATGSLYREHIRLGTPTTVLQTGKNWEEQAYVRLQSCCDGQCGFWRSCLRGVR